MENLKKNSYLIHIKPDFINNSLIYIYPYITQLRIFWVCNSRYLYLNIKWIVFKKDVLCKVKCKFFNINIIISCIIICIVDSFEAHDNGDELDEDSPEYTELSPPSLQAYLYGRSLKKGFNPWSGRRELDHLYKRLVEYNKQHEMTRQRRRPWGGSA